MDELFNNKYRIPSARLKNWNYANNGYYFVTVCTKDRQCYFGDVKNDKMKLSNIGRIAKHELLKTAQIRQNVDLDEWIIMPNHIHAIIVIDNNIVETHYNASLQDVGNRFGPQENNLASIIRGFKSSVKRDGNQDITIILSTMKNH